MDLNTSMPNIPKSYNVYEITQRYQNAVIKKLEALRSNRLIRKTCQEQLDDLHPSRIYDLINGKAELSPFLLWQLFQGKVISLEDLLDGQELSNLPIADQKLLGLVSLDSETVSLNQEALKRNININKLLELAIRGNREKIDALNELDKLIKRRLKARARQKPSM